MNSLKYGPTEKSLKDSLNTGIENPPIRPSKPNEKTANIICILNK